ncbi:hypothetical protein DFJ74DRAFT_713046 [Hyaloraphidium curvatum]|nr:hypothetical protein DFJ74DRAFT_713046 [Hyaloraphidium curvatum]
MFSDPSSIDTSQEPRAVTFENPTGARGAGGRAAGGRKGSPSRVVAAGERVLLADLEGPGTVRHIWLTIPPAPPEVMRAMVLEVAYGGAHFPSVSVPVLDFFGAACGRPTAYSSALTAIQEGRGFNSYVPMPFRDRIRVEFVNGSKAPTTLYYQIDLTLGPVPANAGLLHVSFRRENPTVMRRDFVIADGFRGPGRFLGTVVSIRPITGGRWYGEGEVKMYLDGDAELPTICGTGLEDYVGSAWGLGAHHAPYTGAPLDVRPPGRAAGMTGMPAYVGFYRWHVPDPVVFKSSLKVTLQQIGMNVWRLGQEAERDAYVAENPLAGSGWLVNGPRGSSGLFERVDDVSAAAFLYLSEAQPVPRVDVAEATKDLGRTPYEKADPLERALAISQL